MQAKWTAFALGCAILAATAVWWFYASYWKVKLSYDIARTVRYSFLVTNKTAEYIKDASLSVFAPVKQNSYQETLSITANRNFSTSVDGSGNQSLVFTLKNLAPHSSQVVSITVDLKLASHVQRYKLVSKNYLSPERNIEMDSIEVKSLAETFSESSAIQEITNWLKRNITDIGYIAEDRGARYAIVEKKGDCTEFSSAFVALARAKKIPSRMVGGFTLDSSGKLHADNYHNWAEFERDGIWGIADPQNNIIDSGYGSYIAFYNFDKHSRLKYSQRFLSYDQRLSVQML